MNASNIQFILAAITPIVEAFEQLGINYHIGGSVASSVYGIIRATIDADLVAELRLEQARPFVRLLETDYYIDEIETNLQKFPLFIPPTHVLYFLSTNI